jgi:hypothetical protein
MTQRLRTLRLTDPFPGKRHCKKKTQIILFVGATSVARFLSDLERDIKEKAFD